MKIHHNLFFYTFASALFLLTLKSAPLLAASSENKLDQQKMFQPCAYVFSIHDIDKSGSLSKEEYHQFIMQIENRRQSTRHLMRRYFPPLRFEEIDNDNGGYITEDEMISALNKRLHKHKRYRQRGGQW